MYRSGCPGKSGKRFGYHMSLAVARIEREGRTVDVGAQVERSRNHRGDDHHAQWRAFEWAGQVEVGHQLKRVRTRPGANVEVADLAIWWAAWRRSPRRCPTFRPPPRSPPLGSRMTPASLPVRPGGRVNSRLCISWEPSERETVIGEGAEGAGQRDFGAYGESGRLGRSCGALAQGAPLGPSVI